MCELASNFARRNTVTFHNPRWLHESARIAGSLFAPLRGCRSARGVSGVASIDTIYRVQRDEDAPQLTSHETVAAVAFQSCAKS